MVKLALMLVDLGAVGFLLFVLRALWKESNATAPMPIKAHLARFYPSRKREELILIDISPVKRGARLRSQPFTAKAISARL
jgi:hypothetical protein